MHSLLSDNCYDCCFCYQSDLDDDAMFAQDKMFEGLFNRKKKLKEMQLERVHLKLRSMDLVNEIVKGDRCGDFVVVSCLFY